MELITILKVQKRLRALEKSQARIERKLDRQQRQSLDTETLLKGVRHAYSESQLDSEA